MDDVEFTVQIDELFPGDLIFVFDSEFGELLVYLFFG